MNLASLFSTLLLVAAQTPAAKPVATPYNDPPTVCDSCVEWNQPQTPFKLHGRSYYVGTQGLSSVMIDTGAGLIVIDGGLPQSAALIEANMKTLGFKVADIKLILDSHAHYDHVGGIAKLQRDSGATVASTASGAKALMRGGPTDDDPQYGTGKEGLYPRVPQVKVIKDGEVLRVGETALTAHATPGHTPGGTTWTWRSCEGQSCVNMVYADSLNAVSLDGFHFSGDASHPDATPAFRKSIGLVGALPCDILVSAHPSGSGLLEKLKRSQAAPSAPNAFIDKEGCKAYAAAATKRLDERIASERQPAKK